MRVVDPKYSAAVNDFIWLVEPQVRPCGGPFFFTRSVEPWTGDHIVSNGSFGLVDTGEKKLLVTCLHVWEGFQKERENYPDLQICIGLIPDEILPLGPIQPIDDDRELDIVTFDMSKYLDDCKQAKFAPLRNTVRVKNRDRLACIGYPGRVKAENRIGAQFLRAPYAIAAYDVNEWFIMSNLENVRPAETNRPELARVAKRPGMSGAPCFVVRRHAAAGDIAGFVSSDTMDILKITRANCINIDGTIRRRW